MKNNFSAASAATSKRPRGAPQPRAIDQSSPDDGARAVATARVAGARATIRDVALAAGVSNFTVSCALNGKEGVSPSTREVVQQVARELGYRPNPHAQRLVAGRDLNAIALFSLNLDFGVSTRKMRELQKSLLDRGFSAAIHGFGHYATHNERDQVAVIADLRRQAPRAIVCETKGLQPAAVEELRLYQSEGGVLVSYWPTGDVHLECDEVALDYAAATADAARFFVEHGHREPGVFMLSPTQPDGPLLEGFARGLEAQGARLRPEFVLWGGDVAAYEEAGEQIAAKFLALRERPSAAYIINDYVAQVFIAEVGRAGVRVPHDLSVIGNDDAPIARCGIVPLTTISHPVSEIANRVLELLYSRLEGRYDGPPRREIIASELVVRQSVVALKPEFQ